MPDRPAITADYVLGLYRWGLSQKQERGLRTFIKETRELYDMRRAVRIPKEYKAITQEIRTPLFRDIAQRITASLTKDPPIEQVTPRSDTDDTKKAASIAGRWLMATKEEMTRQVGEDIIYLSALDTVLDSESVVKVVHRPEAWANFPTRGVDEGARAYANRAERHRKGGVFGPFAWRVVNRQQMLFGDGEYGDEWSLEYGEYSTPYLDRRYDVGPETPTPETTLAGPSFPEASGLASKTIKHEFFESGIDGQWAVLVNGRMAPGFPKPNPYAPYLPHIRAQSVPAMYPFRYLVPALDSLLTMKMNWAYLTTFPIPVMEALAGVQGMVDSLPTGDTGEPPTELKWRPGKLYFPPAGYRLRFVEPPGTGRDVDQMIDQLREMIDIAGIPSVFRGIGGSRQAGYAVNQLYAAAQMTYRKLVEALERQQENVDRLLFTMVDHTLDQKVYVLGEEEDAKKWLGLKPTGAVEAYVAPIDALGPPDVSFRPVLPTDEQALAMIGMQIVNAPVPLVSPEAAIRHYLPWVDDPQAMVDDIWASRALDSPQVAGPVIQEAMRLAGLPLPGAASAPGGAAPQVILNPNDMTNSGQPTVPGLTQPMVPNTPIRPVETVSPGQGGRPEGAYPGQPAGQG